LVFQHIPCLDYCYVRPLSIHTMILGQGIVEHCSCLVVEVLFRSFVLFFAK
jgi:hypothetical protein